MFTIHKMDFYMSIECKISRSDIISLKIMLIGSEWNSRKKYHIYFYNPNG